MNLGENIKKIRKEKGLTQKQLGEKLGISQAAIGQFESNKANPKLETIQKIADALNVTMLDFFSSKANGDTVIDLSGVKEIDDNPNSLEKYLFSILPELEKQAKQEHEIEEQIEIESLVGNYLKLNNLGQQKAIEQVELLTEIPKYQKAPKG